VVDAAPTGTLTFLFTDLVDSTPLWARHADAMSAALAEHDALIRAAIAECDGYVFSTAGDSFAAAFVSADAAAATAVAIQRALTARRFDEVGELIVRIGAHTGTAEVRDGDYFGPDVNLAARVMGAAHGHQILLSDATAALTDTATVDLGPQELKGVAGRPHLHQVVGVGLPESFPALATAASVPTNLRAARVEVIGRGQEMVQADKLLDRHRVVTLTGPGGVGKTTVALETARRRVPRDGVWFVDLVPAATDDDVARATADALSLTDSGGATVADQVVNHLRDLQAVVIFDNCEHVIDAAADLIDVIEASAAGVQVLATSREVLDLPAEAVLPIGPLALPDDDSEMALRAAPAIELLCERATAADPDLVVDVDELRAARRVCEAVDGLPLAIELAAAQLRVMSMAELADQLAQRVDVLRGRRGRAPRHRTLESVIGWSYELLDPDEARVFTSLSVFSGGFTAEAVGVVAPAGLGAIDHIGRLVEKSLLIAARTDDGTRYRMLETVRDHFLATGKRIGVKPAGGIRTAKQALQYLVMVKETAGDDWLTPELFRFGASSLLGDVELQLAKRVDGNYQSANYFAKG